MLGTREIIGIDLGGTRAKAVVLAYGPGNTEVSIRGHAMVSCGDPGQPLGDLLRQLLRKLGSRCRDCAVSAWPEGARLRLFEGKTEPGLLRAVRAGTNDASTLFYEPLENYVTQCGPVENLGAEGATFIACGIPRPQLNAMEKELRKLRYRLRHYQLAPVSVLNAFAASRRTADWKQPFLVVDFGRARMTIVGGFRGNVTVMRRVDFPWGEIPESLISVARASMETDEYAEGEEEALAAIYGDVADLVVKELQPVLDSFGMQEDTKETAGETFRVRENSASLERVYVCGGLSNHRPVMQRLTRRLQIQFSRWNPFRHIVAHRKALKKNALLSDLIHLPAAAGAAFQIAA